MSKQTHLTLRLDRAQAQLLQAEAEAEGISLSAGVRGAIKHRHDVAEAAAAASTAVADALRAEIQALHSDLDAKLRLVSDQIAVLSQIAKENRK